LGESNPKNNLGRCLEENGIAIEGDFEQLISNKR